MIYGADERFPALCFRLLRCPPPLFPLPCVRLLPLTLTCGLLLPLHLGHRSIATASAAACSRRRCIANCHSASRRAAQLASASRNRLAMEIDFKITSEDILAIKQARPWSAERTSCLRTMWLSERALAKRDRRIQRVAGRA